MANEVYMKVDGLATFARQCRRIGKEAQAKLRETNLHAAQMVVPEAERRAPKGPHEGGPKGRGVQPISTSIRAVSGQRFAAVRAGSARSPHAPVYEFGGEIPRRGARATHGSEIAKARAGHRAFGSLGVPTTRIQPRPYVFPAVEAMVPRINPVYAADFAKLIREAFPL
jgi:hypothetical protein